ncbi:hypothetical protein C4J94_4436 [Pseudomonas sp. R5-89-07]|nr:hypothetical protein C4J94_4436 [Pseudomonas sp. R5-89-07]
MRGVARDGSKHRSDMVTRCLDTLGAGSTRSGRAWVSRWDYRKGYGNTTSGWSAAIPNVGGGLPPIAVDQL